MRVLVSDANILIDIEKGQLTGPMFRLPFEFVTPDMLFHDELAECHGQLVDYGLQCRALNEQTLRHVFELAARYSRVSRYDCMALALALHDDCALLTGDKALRQAAEVESVSVHGTLWLVEALVTHRLLSTRQAQEAYERMKQAGSRLPWVLAQTRLQALLR